MTRYGAFNFTHEAMAQILGVSRSGVSLAAGLLQMNGLIRYPRGCITLPIPKVLSPYTANCRGLEPRTLAAVVSIISSNIRTFL